MPALTDDGLGSLERADRPGLESIARLSPQESPHERRRHMNPTYDYKGQVAVVTGAGSGMGLASAQAFADAGATVVLADRDETALSTAAERLMAAGHRALGVACDV